MNINAILILQRADKSQSINLLISLNSSSFVIPMRTKVEIITIRNGETRRFFWMQSKRLRWPDRRETFDNPVNIEIIVSFVCKLWCWKFEMFFFFLILYIWINFFYELIQMSWMVFVQTIDQSLANG